MAGEMILVTKMKQCKQQKSDCTSPEKQRTNRINTDLPVPEQALPKGTPATAKV